MTEQEKEPQTSDEKGNEGFSEGFLKDALDPSEENRETDASYEEVEQQDGEPDAPDTGAGEEAESLEALKKANAELTDQLLRKNAEFYNYRNRTAREKEEIGLVAKSKCISELLPVMDNFERAMGAECSDAEFKKGMEMILKSMADAFKKLNVEEIEAVGKPFDPELHYAVSTVEDEELGPNTVAAVLQKGYKAGDKVIRHAMVAVANP